MSTLRTLALVSMLSEELKNLIRYQMVIFYLKKQSYSIIHLHNVIFSATIVELCGDIPLTKEYPVYNLLGPSVSVGQAIKDTYLYMYYLLCKGFVVLLFSFPTPLFMNTEHLNYN